MKLRHNIRPGSDLPQSQGAILDRHWVPLLYDAPFSRSFFSPYDPGCLYIGRFWIHSRLRQCQISVSVLARSLESIVAEWWRGHQKNLQKASDCLIVSTVEHKDRWVTTRPQHRTSTTPTHSLCWYGMKCSVVYIGCCCQVISKRCFSVILSGGTDCRLFVIVIFVGFFVSKTRKTIQAITNVKSELIT